MNFKFKITISIIVFITISILLWIFIFSSKVFNASEFDSQYNDERKENNIPELKENWLVNNKNALLQYYNEDSLQNGHIKKYINFGITTLDWT